MKEVIRVNLNQNEQVEEKPVEFTHYIDHDVVGWSKATVTPKEIKDNDGEIVHLGKCVFDGDTFAVYVRGAINIFKGHLNSGKY